MSEARWTPQFEELENGIKITVTQPTDPAYALLMDPTVFSTPVEGLFRYDCYICRDPEFAQMGLPLCYKCIACGGHVPADDIQCTDCDADQEEIYHEKAVAECKATGHIWKFHESYTIRAIKWDSSKKFNEQGEPEDITEPAYTSCERCHVRQE